MYKYFLYIRKSTDEDDRQVLSLEAQETELREFAEKERLTIIDTFRESQTAKEPGRPIFNKMLERIEKGEADGILAWHPDRLARNSVDGGKIIFLIDSEKIKSLKFPTFWFEATPQGKFMLNIAFGQSKYFVDNLSENTKRGLRQKLRRGELPGPAPLGYLNDLRTHTIVKDPERFRLVRKIFELYATGNYSLKDLRKFTISAGLFSRSGNKLSVKEQAAQDGIAFTQNLKAQIKEREEKLDKLLDAHLEGVISKTEYLAKKQKILNEKVELSEKLKDFERKGNHWLEPAKKFILAAKQAKIIALQKNLFAKKRFSKKDWLEPHFAGAESFCGRRNAMENTGKSERRAAKPRSAFLILS